MQRQGISGFSRTRVDLFTFAPKPTFWLLIGIAMVRELQCVPMSFLCLIEAIPISIHKIHFGAKIRKFVLNCHLALIITLSGAKVDPDC